jgi:hypothetical protein
METKREAIEMDWRTKLYSINWNELRHSNGSAGDLPELILSLVDGSGEEREYALQSLHETICDNGAAFEASAYVVPFLFEFLQDPELLYTEGIAYILGRKDTELSIKEGIAYLLGRLGQVQEIHDSNRETPYPKLMINSQEAEWVYKTRQAISQQVERLGEYLDSEFAELRMCIAATFGLYPEKRALLLPYLQNALQKESNSDMSEVILHSIESLSC